MTIFLSVMFEKFKKDYPTTGEFFATRARTARTVARRVVDPTKPQELIDVGGGWGPIAAAMQELMHKRSRILTVEPLPDRIEYMRERFRDDSRCIVHQGSATDLRAILDTYGIPFGDGLVFSLPFSHFQLEMRRQIMDQIHQSVVDGGPIVGFQFLPHAKRAMRERFGKKNVRTRWMWSPYRRFETHKNGYVPPDDVL